MRSLKELPKYFYPVILEFTNRVTTFWATRRDDKREKIESPENIALLFVSQKNIIEELEQHQLIIENKLLEIFDGKDGAILLGEYGIKVVYEAELGSLRVEKMATGDFKKFDSQANAKYLSTMLGR